MSLLIKCKGPCNNEVNSAEVDSTGWCTLCRITLAAAPFYERYRDLWARRLRYINKGHPHASLDKQLVRAVREIGRVCHVGLPIQGATRLVNEITERARAEAEGRATSKILTVEQALRGSSRPKVSLK